ncbi:PH domain-containing protein [Gracilibacillus alcaliphilus]
MSEPKRLHPAAMIFNIIQAIKQSVLGLLPLVIIALTNGVLLIVMVISAVVLLAGVILVSVLSWLRFTYQLEDDQLRIERGILIRKKRTISKHRIQSIDLSQNVIHRIFGLTKVQIETAGNDPATDAALSAVSMAEGQRLHDELKYKKQVPEELEADLEGQEEEQPALVQPDPIEETELPRRKITLKTLLIAGSTSASFGILLGIFGVVFSQAEALIPDEFYSDASRWVLSLGAQLMIVLGIVVVIFLWLLSILQTVIKNWDFTITRYEKELFITRGLLEKKQSTIPLKKIQAIGIKESIVHQPLGFVSVYVEIASGEVNQNEEMHTLIFPLMRKKDLTSFLAEILPEYSYETEQLVSLPKKALPYYLVRSAIIPLLATIGVGIFFLSYIWIPLIILIIALLYGFASYHTAGYVIDDRQITVQSRILGKDTAIIKQHRVQALARKQNPLHRKQALVNMDMAILNKMSGRHFIIRELRVEDGNKIADWYSYQKESSS